MPFLPKALQGTTHFDKPIVKQLSVHLDNETITIVVLKDTDYYNIHRLTEQFGNDESNSLILQESISDLKQDDSIKSIEGYFSSAYCMEYILKYLVWSRYYPIMNIESITIEEL